MMKNTFISHQEESNFDIQHRKWLLSNNDITHYPARDEFWLHSFRYTNAQ